MIEFLKNPWILASIAYGLLIAIFGLLFLIKGIKNKK